MRKTCYRCFAGNDLYEGDTIIHPDGDKGLIVWSVDKEIDQAGIWKVKYKDGASSRLSLQIGPKGMGVKFTKRFK